MVPAVSVIIPTYNRRAMVGEAIASVLAQQGANFELIVVDDGSADGTWSELERIRAALNGRRPSSPMRIVRTENRGPAAARNFGAALAAAPLLAFLDSDDLWLPPKLARQLAFMRAYPQCAIAQTEELWLRNGRRVNPGLRHRKRAGDFFIDALRTCLVSPSAVILRTALFRGAGGFDEDMAAAEDYDLWLRILAKYPVGLLGEMLVARRAGHPGQLSVAVPALDRFRILALAKLLTGMDLEWPRRRAVGAALAEKCGIYAAGLARRGRIEAARFYLEVAERAGRSCDPQAGAAWTHTVAAMRALLKGCTADVATRPAADATQ